MQINMKKSENKKRTSQRGRSEEIKGIYRVIENDSFKKKKRNNILYNDYDLN